MSYCEHRQNSWWGRVVVLLGVWVSIVAQASVPRDFPFVERTVGGTTIYVHFLADNIVRVQKYAEGKRPEKKSYAVVMSPDDVWARAHHEEGLTGLSSGTLYVTIDEHTGQVTFYHQSQVLLREGSSLLTPKISQTWMLEGEEDIFGLGQLRDTTMSMRGREFEIWNRNTYTSIPYFTSEKGYGLYWDNAGRSWFSSTTDADGGAGQKVTFASETGQMADYYFMYGGTQDGVIDCIRRLTGQATMFPLWTLGHWQCRERYKTSDELAEVLDRYRELRIPLDAIVQDWQYWGCDSNWNAMKFQNPYYINKVGDPVWEKYLPDDLKKLPVSVPRLKSPQQMVDYVHQHQAHLMISIWANFGPWTEPYKELKAIGALLPFDTWPRNKGVMPYDPFNPKARDIYWQHLKHLYDMGFDAWWTDSSEPDHFEKEGDDDVMTYDGPWKSVKNAFPLMHNKGIYEHQRAEMNKLQTSNVKPQTSKRCVQMTRSGAFGLQHYGTFSWSGDIQASWDEMKKQVPSGLNYTLCGIPFWNTDIGGFFYWDYRNDPKNPQLQELHSRWMQWGTFMPLMRNHCSSPMVSELYHFGQPGEWAYDVQVDAIRLRYRLLPYIYSMAGEVVQHSGSMMRPLVMDFAGDKKAIRLNDEYMFGRCLLVKPVSDASKAGPGQPTDVTVYLPKARWYDFYTNRLYDGGQTVRRSTPISEMPVYVRAGSILPFGPEVQTTGEQPWDSLEIRIYTGADGHFTLYEDEGDNYNYEQGAFTEIGFEWDDARRTLTIGGRKGRFEGMLKKRHFRIVLVDSHSPRGDQPMPGGRVVEYKGKKTVLKIKD